jgi:hypothetical protein
MDVRHAFWHGLGGLIGTILVLSPGVAFPEGPQHPGSITPVDQKTGPLQKDDRDDEVLAGKLEEKLRMDERINWQLLQLNVKNGHVTLHGVVKTPEEKGLATLIAMSEPGVKGISNTVLVQENAPETQKKPDLTEKDGKAVLEGEGQIKEQQILP